MAQDIGEKNKRHSLDPANAEMCAMTEAMLYAASRAQIVSEVIKPALQRARLLYAIDSWIRVLLIRPMVGRWVMQFGILTNTQ